ncbi:hypothetical protein DITRI_Ditri11bG0045200 [Diplodiscus trichospermus]
MEKAWKIVLFSCLVVSFLASSSAQTCLTQTFSSNKQYAKCNDLPVLNCFLHWTYDQAAGTLDIAFRHIGTSSSRWSAWALNPSGPRMLGSQALVAFANSSGVAHAFTTSIDSMSPSMQPSNLSFPVSNLSATFENNNEMTIFAVLSISESLLSTSQVWQEGPVSNGQLGIHPTSGANLQSTGSINFLTGQSGGSN